jgi:fluoride exporter
VTPLLVALGAAFGAPLRFWLGHLLDRDFPWGTWAANVAGSFLLGLFSAWSLGEESLALLGAGFCGGFTTYSAFAVKAHDRGAAGGTTYVVATVPVALAACALGFWLG